MWEERGVHTILVVKLEVKGQTGRSGRRRLDNINMYLQEVGWGVESTYLAEDTYSVLAFVNAVMKLWFP